jgi:hypothetical protein
MLIDTAGNTRGYLAIESEKLVPASTLRAISPTILRSFALSVCVAKILSERATGRPALIMTLKFLKNVILSISLMLEINSVTWLKSNCFLAAVIDTGKRPRARNASIAVFSLGAVKTSFSMPPSLVLAT